VAGPRLHQRINENEKTDSTGANGEEGEEKFFWLKAAGFQVACKCHGPFLP
jgi:hypothetical protein